MRSRAHWSETRRENGCWCDVKRGARARASASGPGCAGCGQCGARLPTGCERVLGAALPLARRFHTELAQRAEDEEGVAPQKRARCRQRLLLNCASAGCAAAGCVAALGAPGRRLDPRESGRGLRQLPLQSPSVRLRQGCGRVSPRDARPTIAHRGGNPPGLGGCVVRGCARGRCSGGGRSGGGRARALVFLLPLLSAGTAECW